MSTRAGVGAGADWFKVLARAACCCATLRLGEALAPGGGNLAGVLVVMVRLGLMGVEVDSSVKVRNLANRDYLFVMSWWD